MSGGRAGRGTRSARGAEPIRITTAAESREAELRGRQRRYLFSMSLRTVCFVGAILVGAGWLRWVLVGGALLLPYVAVVMANAAHARRDSYTLPEDLGRHRELGGGAPPFPAGD